MGSLPVREVSLALYRQAHQFAISRGIVLLDTKLEFGLMLIGGRWVLVIIDEMFTMDSSRFVTAHAYESALSAGVDPPSMDKEPVRHWARALDTLAGQGLNKLDMKIAAHRAFVRQLQVPTILIEEMVAGYPRCFELLAGLPIRRYREKYMGISD